MTDSRSPATPWHERGVIVYVLICLAALGGMFFVLQTDEPESAWSYLPLMVGLTGIIAFRERAPLLLLFALGAYLSMGPHRWRSAFASGFLRPTDLLLCGSVLAYMIAQYRLQGLVDSLRPEAGGRRPEGKDGGGLPAARRAVSSKAEASAPQPRRSPRTVTAEEIGRLLLSLLLWAVWAQVCWKLLPHRWGNPGVSAILWRAVLLAWMIGTILFLAIHIYDYWARRQMSAKEATAYLQEVLWNETRGEQRRLNRWLAWARLGKPMGVLDWATAGMVGLGLTLYLLLLLAGVVLLLSSWGGGN